LQTSPTPHVRIVNSVKIKVKHTVLFRIILPSF
jgi:hypothetical protein